MAFENLPKREEYLRKKRKRKLIKYGVIAFLTLLIMGVVIYISHRPNIRISKVELSGGVLVTEEDISVKSLSYLQGSYLWLFPKNNAFLYPKKSLQNYLKETFKRIDTINIHKKDLRTLSVEITERKPFAIWCSSLPTQTKSVIDAVLMEDGATTEQCYFIDQNSTVFALAPSFSGDAYFKYYGLVSASDPIGKEYIASTTKFLGISNFVNVAKKLGIRPLYLIAKTDHEFSLVLSGGGEIYFDTQEPLQKVADNLTALLRAPELSLTSSGNLPVEYIDLRYGNKLFYKLK